MTQFERMQKKGGNVDKIGDHLKPEICDYAEICNFEKFEWQIWNFPLFLTPAIIQFMYPETSLFLAELISIGELKIAATYCLAGVKDLASSSAVQGFVCTRSKYV